MPDDSWLEAAYEMRTEIADIDDPERWEIPGSYFRECPSCEGACCERCQFIGVIQEYEGCEDAQIEV